MDKSQVQWVWATPPDEALRRVARDLVDGVLPEEHTLLKENRPRSVWRSEAAGGVLLKHYRVRTKEVLKALVMAGRAEREFRSMESLCRLGVPTTRPLGYAERRQGPLLREAWFIGRLVPGARTLVEAMADRGADLRWELAVQAMELVARLHDHPYLHRDLHANNLLLDQQDRLLVIDLHSMWSVPLLTPGMRVENLARLLYSLRGQLRLDRAPELLAVYAARRGESTDRLVRRVRRGLDRFERDYVRGRAARCMRHSSEYTSRRTPEGTVHRLREYTLDQLRADLDEHAAHVAAGGERLLGDARASRVSLVGEPGNLRVVKEYRRRGLGPALRQLCGWGRARCAWKAARRFQVEGVPTPPAQALLERRDGRAVLVTRAVMGARSLEELGQAAGTLLDPPQRARLAFALGHVVGRLSRAGLRHADLSDKNVMVAAGPARPTRDLRTTPPGGLPDIQLIDLDGVRRTRPHDRHALVRMLTQLGDLSAHPSRTERLRFLRGFRLAAGRDLPPSVVREAGQGTAARRARREALQSLSRPVC